VAKSAAQDVPVFLTGLGSVTAFNTANIKSRVDGQIMRVNFKEGQTVKQADLLIVIDPRPFQVQLETDAGAAVQGSRHAARRAAQSRALYHPHPFRKHRAAAGRYAEILVDQLDGQVRNRSAQIDNAKLQLIYCNITAPFTGRVVYGKWTRENIVHAPTPTPCLF